MPRILFRQCCECHAIKLRGHWFLGGLLPLLGWHTSHGYCHTCYISERAKIGGKAIV